MNGLRFFRAGVKLPLLLVVFLTWLPVSAARSAQDGGFQFKKISELQRIQPKKPVRIKLKRTVKGEYSWELAGDDADEILKADRQLRKVLKPVQEQKNHGHVNR
jgi:hypothetical protein